MPAGPQSWPRVWRGADPQAVGVFLAAAHRDDHCGFGCAWRDAGPGGRRPRLSDKALFAGAAADALTLFERFEQKLDEYEGDLKRSVVEMAKDWRTDKILRHLEALLLVMDKRNSFIIAGDGNVIEPDGPIVAIGSGGGFAQAAATAFHQSGKFSVKQIAEKSLKIAADLCIYTNDSITLLEIK